MALMEARDEEDGRGDSENSYIKTCKLISEVKEKSNTFDKTYFGSFCCTLIDEYCSVNKLDSIEVSQWIADNVKIMNEKCGGL